MLQKDTIRAIAEGQDLYEEDVVLKFAQDK